MNQSDHQDVVDLVAMDAAGFDAFYAEHIEPLLERFESTRRNAVTAFKARLMIGAPLALLLTFGVFVVFNDIGPAIIAAAVSAVITYAVAYMPLQSVAVSVKSSFLTMLSRTIGARFQSTAFSPPAFDRFRALNLAPSYDRATFEDHFSGARHGCGFDLYEAHLENETKDKDGDSSWSTVFRGQLIRITFPKPFLGTTIVRRDAGIFNGLLKKKTFQRIGLGDPKFERTFEVYGTDQVEARALVHPFFMERLLEIETVYQGKKVRCGFEDGDLLVAIEGGDKFEVGNMFKPIADPERARRIVRDIAQILKLMDAVLTAETAHLLGR